MERRTFVVGTGTLLATPLVARASRLAVPVGSHARPVKTLRRIGLLGEADGSPWDAFCEGLSELGWIEGRNVSIHRRFAYEPRFTDFSDRCFEQLSSHSADLIRRNVEVIVTAGFSAILARDARATIPTVFLDLEAESSFVEYIMVRPEGYVTGVTTISSRDSFIPEIVPKLREHLKELLPWGDPLALLCRPETMIVDDEVLRNLRAAAAACGVSLPIVRAHTAKELKHAFARLAAMRASALVVTTNPEHWSCTKCERIEELARRCHVTPFYVPVLPGLIRYESDRRHHFRQGASYVDRLLKGATPADLPVGRTDELELVVNWNAAAIYNIPIPHSLLARTSRLIPWSGYRSPPWRELRRELWKEWKAAQIRRAAIRRVEPSEHSSGSLA